MAHPRAERIALQVDVLLRHGQRFRLAEHHAFSIFSPKNVFARTCVAPLAVPTIRPADRVTDRRFACARGSPVRSAHPSPCWPAPCRRRRQTAAGPRPAPARSLAARDRRRPCRATRRTPAPARILIPLLAEVLAGGGLIPEIPDEPPLEVAGLQHGRHPTQDAPQSDPVRGRIRTG